MNIPYRYQYQLPVVADLQEKHIAVKNGPLIKPGSIHPAHSNRYLLLPARDSLLKDKGWQHLSAPLPGVPRFAAAQQCEQAGVGAAMVSVPCIVLPVFLPERT